MQVVWFKRDLRIEDNIALSQAAQHGAVLPLYILEPQLWQQPDISLRHYQFLQNCLGELNTALTQLGQPLIIKVGEAVEVLQELHKEHGISTLWSHQETWNGWSYNRDKHVKTWAKNHTISWHEPTQHGVIRCLQDRDGWAAKWYGLMKQPIAQAPKTLQPITIASDVLPTPQDFGLHNDHCNNLQQGGRKAALSCLHSFLYERGEPYTKAMSSPVTAYDACSRLSPHLAFGTISMREVFQATQQRTQELKQLPPHAKGTWGSAMRSFSGRLRWHCHFIQKLEDEPQIEYQNMHPVYNGLRENAFNQDYFEAWQAGKTGYLMIDACMRALTTTGWLNFRMRAMLMSFASYHLWLHWRQTSLHLARLFTDYEPGIHYSQAQMQSGTTGINAVRIYNPIKQGQDHDPDGVFIKQWVPELADMPIKFIHTPWLQPSHLNGYPMPIVDEKIARKQAAAHIYGVRKNPDHKATSKQIVQKHASRKSGLKRTGRKKKPAAKNTNQGELPL